jgi:hypothetical protein
MFNVYTKDLLFDHRRDIDLQICAATHGTRGGAIGSGTALQTGRSWETFPMVSLEFSIDIILLAALWPWGANQPITEMNTRNISWA